MLRAFLLTVALAIAGCSSTPDIGNPATQADAEVDGFLSNLGQFTQNDLETAMKLTGDLDLDGKVDPGMEPGDPIALACYSYLHGKLATAGGGDLITVEGAISGFQSVRNLRRRVSRGASDEFILGCGPLVTDVRMNVLKLFARFGSGGILPF